MANARTYPEESTARTQLAQPSLLRLTVVALVLALAFDAVSTALAWDVVRALPETVRRGPVHAVRATDVKEPGRHVAPDATDAAPESP
jgi:hypothetical protein